MNKLFSEIKRLLFLPLPLVIVISIPAFVFVVCALIFLRDNLPISILSYVFSAYALTISVIAVFRFIPKARAKINKNKLYRSYREDVTLRLGLSLLPSAVMNLLYVAIKLCSGIFYGSFWFVSVAVYYALLFSLRLSLFSHIRKRRVGRSRIYELKRARATGVLLVFLDLSLTGILVFMVGYGRSYRYPGLLIYAMAAYTFYALISASISVIKYRRLTSPIMLASKVIKLTSALVSILSLESAMLGTFGSGDIDFNMLMTALTGAGVCAIILAMALYLAIKPSKELEYYKGKAE